MRHSLWGSPVFRTLLSVLWGMLSAFAGTLLISCLLLFMYIPERVLMLTADILWGISAFSAGSRSGVHARRHGIGTGLLCGLLLCGILLAGCVCMDGIFSAHIAGRCGIILLASVCGGVRGVNRKITKPPY